MKHEILYFLPFINTYLRYLKMEGNVNDLMQSLSSFTKIAKNTLFYNNHLFAGFEKPGY